MISADSLQKTMTKGLTENNRVRYLKSEVTGYHVYIEEMKLSCFTSTVISYGEWNTKIMFVGTTCTSCG